MKGECCMAQKVCSRRIFFFEERFQAMFSLSQQYFAVLGETSDSKGRFLPYDPTY